jgi:hypothetical protein
MEQQQKQHHQLQEYVLDNIFCEWVSRLHIDFCRY